MISIIMKLAFILYNLLECINASETGGVYKQTKKIFLKFLSFELIVWELFFLRPYEYKQHSLDTPWLIMEFQHFHKI